MKLTGILGVLKRKPPAFTESDPCSLDIDTLEDNPTIPLDHHEDFYDGLQQIRKIVDSRKRQRKMITAATCALTLAVLVVMVPYLYKSINHHTKLRRNISFNNETIGKVISTLNEQGIVIIADTDIMTSCRFTGFFSKGLSPEFVMRELSAATGLDCHLTSEKFFKLSGNPCST